MSGLKNVCKSNCVLVPNWLQISRIESGDLASGINNNTEQGKLRKDANDDILFVRTENVNSEEICIF